MCFKFTQNFFNLSSFLFNNFSFWISLRAGNLSFWLLSNTSAISSKMETCSSSKLSISLLLSVLSKYLSLLLLSYYLYQQYFFLFPCNYHFQLSSFPVLLSLAQSSNYYFYPLPSFANDRIHIMTTNVSCRKHLLDKGYLLLQQEALRSSAVKVNMFYLALLLVFSDGILV